MRKKTKIIIFFFLFLALAVLYNFNFAYAQQGAGGLTPSEPVTLPDPLGGGTTPQTLIGKIINAVLGVVGSIALLMFIYGGFVWMTAAGNEQSVTKGKNILIWATVGLIIIFSSYALVKFVFTGLGVG